MLQYEKIAVSKGINTNKTRLSEECMLCHNCCFEDVRCKFEPHVCNNPPGNKTSRRRRNEVSLYVPATSQLRLKWNTQWRVNGTSLRRLSGTSQRYLIGTSWGHLKRMYRQRLISTSSRRLKQVSNETSNNVSLVRHQDVSVVLSTTSPVSPKWNTQ